MLYGLVSGFGISGKLDSPGAKREDQRGSRCERAIWILVYQSLQIRLSADPVRPWFVIQHIGDTEMEQGLVTLLSRGKSLIGLYRFGIVAESEREFGLFEEAGG